MEQKKITLKLPSREKKADAPPRERKRLDDRYRLQRVKREKKRGSAVLAGALSTVSYVLFVLGASMLIAGFGILVANDMLALVKEEREAVVQVTEPTSVAEVSGQLKEMEIIRYRWAFRLYAKLKHADEPEDGQFSVAAGEYTVRTDMDYGQLITRLTTGVRKTRETVTITVTTSGDVEPQETYPFGFVYFNALTQSYESIHDVTIGVDASVTVKTGTTDYPADALQWNFGNEAVAELTKSSTDHTVKIIGKAHGDISYVAVGSNGKTEKFVVHVRTADELAQAAG